MNWTYYTAINNDMVCMNTASYHGSFTYHQNAGATLVSAYIANHFTINAQAVRKPEITFNAGALSNQAFNWRLIFLPNIG